MPADLKFALRGFRKSPGFAAAAVMIAALGIGANTAIFSVVHAVVLRTLPFRDPDQLVMIWEKNPQAADFLADRFPVAIENYLEWKKSASSFSGMSILSTDSLTITGAGQARDVEIARTPPEFGDLFGIRPLYGRVFGPDEDHAAILSYPLFETRFGADPKALGRTIELNGARYTIVGVWPREFHLPAMWEGFDERKPEVWLPLDVRMNQSQSALRSRGKYVYARLRPGVSLARARAEMDLIAARIRREKPDLNAGFGVSVFPVTVEDVGPATRRYVLILQGAVALVLLIACANIANLLLARAIGRRKETAVRVALGASRWRLIRQSMAESLLLSFSGAAAGLVLAYWGIRGIGAMAPRDTPHLHDFQLDSAALIFTVSIAVLTGLIFGLAPSLDAAFRGINEALNQGGRSGAGGLSKRFRGALVAGEVALALVLLVGAGLLIRTVRAMFAADPGFRRDGLLTLRLSLRPDKFRTDEQLASFCRQLYDRAAAAPGVISAAIAGGLPTQSLSMISFSIEGAVDRPGEPAPMTDIRTVGESYFQTMLIPMLRGRGFTREEAANPKSDAAVVNQLFARKMWPGADPIGKALKIGDKRRIVIGVAADVRQLGPETPIDLEVYVPSDRYRQVTLVVRTADATKKIRGNLANVVRAIDPDVPAQNFQTLDEALGEFIADRRFVMSLLAAFAALALILAAAGIYGVLAYSVGQRTREIGIRMALGARAGDILTLIVREGLILAAVGAGIGLAGSFWLVRLLNGLLFGVPGTDPWTFAAGAAVLIACAALASYLPARRAASVAPAEALRTE